jgi:hypothetical protein
VKHQPKPFYLYIANSLNSTAGMNVVHNSLYSRNFAKYAAKAGINYTVYYTDYHGMTADDAGSQRFATPQGTFNYMSSHGWVDAPGVKATGRTSSQEQLLYHCLALGVPGCSAGPGPSPGPGPGPSPGNISAACMATIDASCPAAHTAAQCHQCVTANARKFIAAGCPPAGQGGEAKCEAYCEST